MVFPILRWPAKCLRTGLVAILLLLYTRKWAKLPVLIAVIEHLWFVRWTMCRSPPQLLVVKPLVHPSRAVTDLLDPTLQCTGCPIPLATPMTVLHGGMTTILFLRRWTLLRTPFRTTNLQILIAVMPPLPCVMRTPCKSLTLSILLVSQRVRNIAVKEDSAQALGCSILFTIPTRTAWVPLREIRTPPLELVQTPSSLRPRIPPVLDMSTLPSKIRFRLGTPTQLLGETALWTAPRSVF